MLIAVDPAGAGFAFTAGIAASCVPRDKGTSPVIAATPTAENTVTAMAAVATSGCIDLRTAVSMAALPFGLEQQCAKTRASLAALTLCGIGIGR
jgi:hypothetical protein